MSLLFYRTVVDPYIKLGNNLFKQLTGFPNYITKSNWMKVDVKVNYNDAELHISH